jgi:hypothetical protein
MPGSLCKVIRRDGLLFCETHAERLVNKEITEARLGRKIDQPGSLGLFCPETGTMHSDTTASHDAIRESGIELP